MTAVSVIPGIHVGDVIDGKYRIEHLLGVGGMGVVVAARHLQLDEQVAIKFLLQEMFDVPGAVTRFAREARAAAKIKNEHVVRVTDVGQLEDGTPYMVMEYLAGEDLATWLSQRGLLSIDQAATFVLQACEGLAAAHHLGIVHRDLKPANLFVTHRTNGSLSLKVLDFGISKMDAEVAMTQTSLVMGSPLYMSPEQLRSSKDVDARADIWSIGVILYEVLTGCVPFEGRTVAEVVTQILAMDPISPTRRCAGLPAEIEAAIFKCLKKDRLDRYQSVEELAVTLAQFATSRESYAPRDALTYPSAGNVTPVLVSPRGGGTTPLVEVAPTRTSWERAHVTTLSKRWKMIVLAALSILALGVIAGKLLTPTKPLPSVIAGPTTPSTSNASVMASALMQRPPEPVPALTTMPTADPTRVDSSRANAERSGTKKRNVAAVAPISSKVEPTVVPSAVSPSTLPQSHPFDDRK